MRSSRQIALCGVATAFATVFVVLGNVFSYFDIMFYMLAALCVMLPVVYDNILGTFLCYVASALLGFLFFPNIVTILPYFVFFGLHPVIYALLKKFKVPLVFQIIVKLVFFAGSLIVIYFFANAFVNFSFLNNSIWLVLLAGMVVMCFYDFVFLRTYLKCVERVLDKIIKK